MGGEIFFAFAHIIAIEARPRYYYVLASSTTYCPPLPERSIPTERLIHQKHIAAHTGTSILLALRMTGPASFTYCLN